MQVDSITKSATALGQTLFSVFKNVASEAFGVRYPHSVNNFIRPAEAAIANVANPMYVFTGYAAMTLQGF